jgi:HEAT repeat protein
MVKRSVTVMFLFVGLVGICFCGCENQEQKVERLIKELQDEDLSVRSSAAEALGDIGKDAKDAVPVLVQTLRDQYGSVRTSAANALGKIGEGGIDVVPALIPLLKDQEWIGENAKDVVPALVLLLRGQRTDIFVNATWALVKIGTPEALKGARSTVPDLIKAFKQGRHNFYTYNRVIYALAQIGTPEAIKVIEGEVPALMKALKKKYSNPMHWGKKEECDTAVVALNKIGTPEALKAVKKYKARQ